MIYVFYRVDHESKIPKLYIKALDGIKNTFESIDLSDIIKLNRAVHIRCGTLPGSKNELLTIIKGTVEFKDEYAADRSIIYQSNDWEEFKQYLIEFQTISLI